MPEMAKPTKQALQGSGAGWGYETHYCRRAPARTTFRRALLRAKPTVLMTSYHTRDSVEEEKNRCPIGQSFIYKSTFCGVRSQITTSIIPLDNISFILQAQPVTSSPHSSSLRALSAISCGCARSRATLVLARNCSSALVALGSPRSRPCGCSSAAVGLITPSSSRSL